MAAVRDLEDDQRIPRVASASSSERPEIRSHRAITRIVRRSHATRASFIASVESRIETTRRKKS